MRLADTHAHLSDARFDADRSVVVERARCAGVGLIIDVGADPEGNKRVSAAMGSVAGVYAAVGIHPHYVASATDSDWEYLSQLATAAYVVAIGETGLDWYRNLSPRAAQLDAFAAHLALARDVNLPVIIHNRDADDDVLRVWRSVAGLSGVLHAFASGPETAAAALVAGLFIAVGGPLTYKNAQQRRDVAAGVPLDRLLVETDCPYLPPVPWRGRRNEPSYVALVAAALAGVRGLAPAGVEQATTLNAALLFGLGGA